MTKVNREDYIFKQEVEKLKYEAFCNKCGMSCRSMGGDFNGLIEARVQGGYYSTYLEDGGIYIFSLCERCLKKLFETFKLDAHKGNYTDIDAPCDLELKEEFDKLKKERDEAVKEFCIAKKKAEEEYNKALGRYHVDSIEEIIK